MPDSSGPGRSRKQRGGPLLERGLRFGVDGLGGLERLARLELALRLDRRFRLGLRLDGGHLGRRAAAPLGPLLDRHGCRLHRLHRATALGRGRRFLQLALLPLPRGAHQRHLLRLERREVAAHKDVPLLEHPQELLGRDTKLGR
jgi:hypothetical protein